jgi:hypothetical protein
MKKKTYEVYGHANIICSMQVKATSEEEAIQIANDTFGGLTNYAGMGSCDCLVGVLTAEDSRCIYPDSDPEFDDCKEV